MSLIHELTQLPGVLAAGEYAYRGDRFSYEGQLSEELARMASVMCRSTTMALHMQVDMLKQMGKSCSTSFFSIRAHAILDGQGNNGIGIVVM